MNQEIKSKLKDKKISHGFAAKKCLISRIALNRYLNGHSQIKADTFLSLIKLVGWEVKER